VNIKNVLIKFVQKSVDNPIDRITDGKIWHYNY